MTIALVLHDNYTSFGAQNTTYIIMDVAFMWQKVAVRTLQLLFLPGALNPS